jgi:CheY-like chemotaxis protein
MVAVSDTGLGMTPDVKQHLFEPFFTTKAVGKGTGLGLATVYGIVRQSGGMIAVDSEPGRGTRFRIYFPSADSAGSEDSTAPLEPATAGTGTVLLVEDEPGVRHLARDVLTRYGYTVIEAADGSEALRLVAARDESIDLLLTDVVMPGMSGAELARRFRELRPNVPVLYASGYADEAVTSHGVPDVGGGTPFLQKPFEPDDLVRRVREVMDSK